MHSASTTKREKTRLLKLPGGLAAITVLLLLFSGCQAGQGASWESIGPEQGGIILSLATDPFNSHLVYAGSSTGIVYVGSADAGPNLVPGTGIPHTALVGALLADPIHKGTIYAGTTAGLYVSTDQSASWRARGTGLPPGETMDALAYAKGPNILFAGSSSHGVYASHNQGETWLPLRNGLPADADVNALLFEPSTQILYVAVDGAGVFASTNQGAAWSERSTGLPKEVYALTALSGSGLATRGVTLYAGTEQGIYASTNDGASWAVSGASPRQAIYCLATYGPEPSWIYAGTETDVLRSADGGRNWATIAPGLSNRVQSVASVPTTPSPSAPPYVIFAASANLWRFPPEQGSGGSGALSFLVDGLVLVVMIGLVLYFALRARRHMVTPPLQTGAVGPAGREALPGSGAGGSPTARRDGGTAQIKISANGHRPAVPRTSGDSSSEIRTSRTDDGQSSPGSPGDGKSPSSS